MNWINFFTILSLLQFVQIEAIISSVMDAYPKLRYHKHMVTLASLIILFLGSLIFVTNVSNANYFSYTILSSI